MINKRKHETLIFISFSKESCVIMIKILYFLNFNNNTNNTNNILFYFILFYYE